jgi:predicted porin
MKKSLLALAALSAVAGAASAQSSVTLSGGVDVAIVRQNDAWNVSTGNSGRTNFTLSGREDLGGGMYAFFALNYRFNAATGQGTSAFTSSSFWRQSWVGLGGAWGDVRLGRMLPVLQEFNGGYDPFGTETIGSTHTGGFAAGLAGAARINNAIYYRSPNLGGLQLHANVAAADQNVFTGTAFTSGSERPMGIGVQYAAGPLRAAAAWDQNALDGTTYGLYAAWNFGFMELMGQYENSEVGSLDVDGWSLGARVPFGAAVLKLGYRDLDGGSSNSNQTKFGIGIDYALSKRTIVYTDVAKNSGDNVPSLFKKTQFDVGIWHKF